MKKIFSVLMTAFVMTAMVACGEKDNKSNNENPTPGGGSGSSLPSGMYVYSECTNPDEYHVHTRECGYSWTLGVTNDEDVHVMIYGFQVPNWYIEDEDRQAEDTERDFSGSYNYSATASSGSVDFHEMGYTQPLYSGYSGTGHFTYDDEHQAIIMEFLDRTVTMTRVEAR